MKFIKIIFPLALIVLILGSLILRRDPSYVLINGYELSYVDSSTNGIYKNSKEVVPGYIFDYQIHNDYIYGKRTEIKPSKSYTYYILNTENGEFLRGLELDLFSRLTLDIQKG